MSDTEHNYLQVGDEDDDFPPPRRRINPLTLLGILVLAALVIGGTIFAVARFVGGQRSTNVVPTPTLVPGSNLFYTQITPNWGNIIIDGQVIEHSPTSGNQPPLELSAGVHQVAWHADPLASQRCVIIVPPIISQTTCLANDPITVNVGPNKGLPAYVITFTASLDGMSAGNRASLIQAAQSALDHMQASDTVQPGEHYADLSAPQFIATTSSQLRATLHFQLDTEANSSAACIGEFLGYGSGCDYNGQNCHTFCTLQDVLGVAPTNRWDVFAVIKTLWDYRTLSGQVVGQNQPDETDNSGNEYLINLYITWDGSQWHVATSVPGNTTDFVTPGPDCITASGYVNLSPTGNFYEISGPGGSPEPVYWNSQQASNPAAGCLLTAYLQSGGVANPQPVARCLYRFGVLLALDAAAQKSWPTLPLANAFEQSIAQQIEAQK
jgi:hypothetical protein